MASDPLSDPEFLSSLRPDMPWRNRLLSLRKSKIVDVLRGQGQESAAVNPENEENLNGYFNDRQRRAKGTPPSEWETPRQAMDNQQVREVFEACLGANRFGDAA